MDGQLVTLKMEMNINAQRIMSQYKSFNKEFEQQIEKGIQEAIDELGDGEIKKRAKAAAKQQIFDVTDKLLTSYDLQAAIRQAIKEKLDERIKVYAEKIADKLFSELKDL